MTNARIYKLAYENLLMQIDREISKIIEAEKAGKTHSIADARLAKYYVEEAELHELLIKAEKSR